MNNLTTWKHQPYVGKLKLICLYPIIYDNFIQAYILRTNALFLLEAYCKELRNTLKRPKEVRIHAALHITVDADETTMLRL